MANLHVEKLAKTIKKRRVVKDISLAVSSNEVVGLLGPNGAGKTSLFYMIIGLIKPDHGKVYLDNKNITLYPMHRRAQLGLGYLPQEKSIFQKMSVAENILAVLELRKELNKNQRQQKLNSLLLEFNINHLKEVNAMSLSGGERRRVEIARALATHPNFILLDEPFAGIDPISINDIKNIISHLKERGIGILITDHNVRETLDICDRAYIANDGKIIAQGTSTEILEHKVVKDIYLGEEFIL